MARSPLQRLSVIACALSLTVASSAWASSPPDVVRLKNGGLVRGTIVELQPGKTVQIQLVTGKVKTFPMAEVEFAGGVEDDPHNKKAEKEPEKPPKPEEPGPEKAPAPPKPKKKKKPRVSDEVEITFRDKDADDGSLTLMRHSATAIAFSGSASAVAHGFSEVCVSPCTTKIKRGHYTFALRKGDDVPIKAGALQLEEDSVIEGTYTSKAGTRLVIYGIGAVATVAGTVMFLTQGGDDVGLSTSQIVGLSLMCAGPMALLAPIWVPDQASVRIVPQGDFEVAFRRQREGQIPSQARGALALPRGAALEFTFLCRPAARVRSSPRHASGAPKPKPSISQLATPFPQG